MASILLVDDDSSMRHFLSVALSRAGHEIMTAQNGVEAINEIKGHPENYFDLVLTDIVMPEMDGIQLSKVITDQYPEVKIMFMTGFSVVGMNKKDIEQQSHVVSKPFHLNDLISQIDKTLSG